MGQTKIQSLQELKELVISAGDEETAFDWVANAQVDSVVSADFALSYKYEHIGEGVILLTPKESFSNFYFDAINDLI